MSDQETRLRMIASTEERNDEALQAELAKLGAAKPYPDGGLNPRERREWAARQVRIAELRVALGYADTAVDDRPSGSPVERGMVLLVREEPVNGLPERFRLWAVSSARQTKTGVSVTLLGWAEGCLMTATAMFPDGIVADPWCVLRLSQADLAHVYSALTASTPEAVTDPPASADSAPGGEA